MVVKKIYFSMSVDAILYGGVVSMLKNIKVSISLYILVSIYIRMCECGSDGTKVMESYFSSVDFQQWTISRDGPFVIFDTK